VFRGIHPLSRTPSSPIVHGLRTLKFSGGTTKRALQNSTSVTYPVLITDQLAEEWNKTAPPSPTRQSYDFSISDSLNKLLVRMHESSGSIDNLIHRGCANRIWAIC